MRTNQFVPGLDLLEGRVSPTSISIGGGMVQGPSELASEDPLPDPEPSPGPYPGNDPPVDPPVLPPSGPVIPGPPR